MAAAGRRHAAPRGRCQQRADHRLVLAALQGRRALAQHWPDTAARRAVPGEVERMSLPGIPSSTGLMRRFVRPAGEPPDVTHHQRRSLRLGGECYPWRKNPRVAAPRGAAPHNIGPQHPTLNISRLTWDNLTGNSGELFARIDSPWNIFVKGFVGGRQRIRRQDQRRGLGLHTPILRFHSPVSAIRR
jgi:hypothetical protein